MLVAAIAGAPIVSAQTEKVDEKYRVVLKLNEQSFASLETTGFVKAEIPKSQRDKVVAVKIVKLDAFVDEPLEATAETTISRGVMNIEISKAIMEQLEFRPVLINVTQNGFSKVLLSYNPNKKDDPSEDNSEAIAEQFVEESRFFVRRDKENGIVAGTHEASTLSVKTDYGIYDVPWSKIEAAHFDQSENVSIILRNGDKMSGKLNQNKFKLKTLWGDHEIDSSKIHSFTKTKDQQFLATNSQNGAKFLLYNTAGGRRSVGY